MITQSFLYNAIFFTYGLVLKFFFHVPPASVPYYFFAFAAGNLLGPLTIGRLFDTLGRKKMIAGTYLLSGVLLIITAILFKQGTLNATTQTIAWAVIFFFASAGASAGYLTASEVFPLEVRAKAIAVFFAIAQCFGLLGTHLYGHLIGTGNDPNKLFVGYLIGAGAMIVGGVAEVFLGVAAEGKSLEDIASPLSMVRKAAGSLSDATRSATPAPRRTHLTVAHRISLLPQGPRPARHSSTRRGGWGAYSALWPRRFFSWRSRACRPGSCLRVLLRQLCR